VRFAYADPPYLGRAEYYVAHHPEAMIWDDPTTHNKLIDRLQAEYPDGWVMSLSEQSLRVILPMCPNGARVCAWITDRPRFAGKAVPVRRHFEPVILMGGRDYDSTGNRTGDFVFTAQQPTNEPRYQMKKSDIRAGKIFVGRKPHAFCLWVLDLLGAQPGDDVNDLFPGSGAMSHAITQRLKLQPEPFTLFGAQP
jgi:hypothetical protein